MNDMEKMGLFVGIILDAGYSFSLVPVGNDAPFIFDKVAVTVGGDLGSFGIVPKETLMQYLNEVVDLIQSRGDYSLS